MRFFSRNEGVSLIVATLMATVFMLAALGVAEVWVRIFQENGDFDMSKRTENLAESVVNFARYKAGDKVGANIKSEDLNAADFDGIFKVAGLAGVENCEDIDSDPAAKKPCLGFRVIGRTANDAKIKIPGLSSEYFTVPAAYYDDVEKKIKGTGSAASECKDSGNADDPCYWNKIYVDNVTEIPLYYVDDSGKVNVPSFDVGPTQFKLRVRTPCKDYENGVTDCEASERIELYPKVVTENEYNSNKYPYADIKKDQVLLQWVISDLAGVNNKSLLAKEDFNDTTNNRPYPKSDNPTSEKFFVGQNTEISGGRINDANDNFLILNKFIVLESHHKGQDLDYTTDDPAIGNAIVDLGKQPIGATIQPIPTLRLNLVGQPRKRKPFDINFGSDTDPDSNFLNDTTLFVPYLEYQILTTSYPISDNKKTFFGWAEIGDFYKKSKSEKYLPITAGGFAIGNP